MVNGTLNRSKKQTLNRSKKQTLNNSNRHALNCANLLQFLEKLHTADLCADLDRRNAAFTLYTLYISLYTSLLHLSLRFNVVTAVIIMFPEYGVA